MKKKVLTILFLLFMVAGIFVSVTNFSVNLNANGGTIWGWAIDNPACEWGYECVECEVVNCFVRGSGC